MYKFAVLCACVAAVVAEPGAILAPLAYSGAAVASAFPGSYAYAQPGFIPATPLAYSSPLGYPHFIKKRSAALTSYIAPTTYLASGAPIAATYSAPLATAYSTPYLSSSYIAPATVAYSGAHFIKKRSAAFAAPLATTYTAAAPLATTYSAAAPFIASSYSAAPIVSTYGYPYGAPLAYSGHFIKKRSAPLAVSSYLAPTVYSHGVRLAGSAPLVHAYPTPYSYSGAYGVTRVL